MMKNEEFRDQVVDLKSNERSDEELNDQMIRIDLNSSCTSTNQKGSQAKFTCSTPIPFDDPFYSNIETKLNLTLLKPDEYNTILSVLHKNDRLRRMDEDRLK